MSTRLFDAVRANDLPALLAAIAAGEPLDGRDKYGYTPLLVAVHAGRTALCAALLDAGARPDAHDRKVATRRWERIGKGAAALPRGPGSLLHEAAVARGGGDLIRYLLARGLDLEGRDPDGSTPLMIAASHHRLERDVSGADDPLEALLAAGASVHVHDRVGYGPLDAAYSPVAIERLLAAGADPNGAPTSGGGYHGRSLLIRWSMSTGSPAVVQALLRGGADPQRARGALAWAAHHGNAAIVELLLQHGSSPDDCAGETPALAGAAAFARLAIVRRLLDAGAQERDTALFCAAGHSLLSCGPDVRERPDERLEVVRVLLAAGADPGAAEPRFIGSTPLHTAARVGSTAIAQLLLAAGAPVDAKDGLGRTPLWVAAENGSADVAALLLAAGATARTSDAGGVSAYDIARKTRTPDDVADLYPGTGAQRRVLALLRAASAGPERPAAPVQPAGPCAGDRVRHAKFGEGTLRAIEGDGDAAKYTVEFATAGQKVLLAKFVERLGDDDRS
jgi:ankyrin repeat protein